LARHKPGEREGGSWGRVERGIGYLNLKRADVVLDHLKTERLVVQETRQILEPPLSIQRAENLEGKARQ
jgi:hypothetical protein